MKLFLRLHLFTRSAGLVAATIFQGRFLKIIICAMLCLFIASCDEDMTKKGAVVPKTV